MEGLWHTNAIIYTIDLQSFADGNGDGIGDFLRLSGKLDYLTGLNVNGIWLQPFFPSPRSDHGYDISDYYSVDPLYGTQDEFVEFSQAARDRGLRIIADLVVNHTSIDHPWFRAARRDRNSKYREWYVWSKEKPPNADQGMVLPGAHETTWTFDEEAGEYYYHRFYSHQPDLTQEIQQSGPRSPESSRRASNSVFPVFVWMHCHSLSPPRGLAVLRLVIARNT